MHAGLHGAIVDLMHAASKSGAKLK
jgi:hypothetical protein